MSCFIYSESNNIPVDFWNYINFSDDPETLDLLSLNDARININNRKTGNGFIININEVIYIITCFHIVGKNNVKNIAYFYDSNNKLHSQNIKIKNIIEEFDIAIMEPENPKAIDPKIIYKKENLLSKISEYSSTSAFINHISSDDLQNFTIKKIRVDIRNIENIDFVSQYFPHYGVPTLNIIFHEQFDENEIKGMSGSLLLDNEIPLGMITDGNDSLNVLPISIIMYLIENTLSKKKANFEGILINIESVNFYPDQQTKYKPGLGLDKSYIKGKKYYGHVIDEHYDISYSKKGKIIPFKFKKDDVIIKVDNNYINSNGHIYSDDFGYPIKICLYLMLSFYKKTFVSIDYVRNSKISKINKINKVETVETVETVDTVTIRGTSIDQHLSFHIKETPYFLYYNGLVFVELSEELLEYFGKKRISLEGNIDLVNNETKLSKYVILVHVNYACVRNTYIKGIDELEKNNFPYINQKLFILNKIGNEMVNGIKSLYRILKQKNEKQRTFNYNVMNNNIKNISTVTLESNNNISYIRYSC